MTYDEAWLQSVARTAPEKLARALARGVTRGADIVRKAISANAGGDVLHRRTGTLARSFRSTDAIVQTEGNKVAIAAGVYNDASGVSGGPVDYKGRTPYADIQEYGGTVKPINSKYLAIPVFDALTKAGVPRLKSPLDNPALIFVKRKDGLMMLGESEGKKFSAWYILKKSVKIPASHYMSKGFDSSKDRAAQEVENQVNSAINSEIVRGIA